MVDGSSSFVELVECRSMVVCMATSTRSSAFDGASVRLVLEGVRLLTGGIPRGLKRISAALSGEKKERKKLKSVVHVGRPGGEIY